MNAINASSTFPPHDPWMAGETLNYYYLGHLLDGDAGARALGWSRARATTSPSRCCSRSPRRRCSRWRGRCGRPRSRAACAPAGGRSAPGSWRWRCASCSATSPAPASGWRPTSPPGDYDWFGASRVIPDTINEFPAFSFTARRPARARAGDAVHAARARRSRCRSRSPGRAATLAWRAVAEALAAGLAVGALYAINSWSYPVAAGLLVGAVVVWMRGAGGATGGARSAPSGPCSCSSPASCSCCRSG